MTSFPARGILFDCDGVLVDSLEPAAVAWDRWSAEWAPHFDFRRDIAHGTRAADTIARLVEAARFEAAIADLDRHELETVEGTVAIEGAVALTASLPDGSWTVVTSGVRPLARARLQAAGIAEPAALITADDVTRGKPDPEPYLRGAELLGLDPADCIVLEDAPAGIAAARAAGVGAVIGIGAHAAEGAPDALVADLRDLIWRDGRLDVLRTL